MYADKTNKTQHCLRRALRSLPLSSGLLICENQRSSAVEICLPFAPLRLCVRFFFLGLIQLSRGGIGKPVLFGLFLMLPKYDGLHQEKIAHCRARNGAELRNDNILSER